MKNLFLKAKPCAVLLLLKDSEQSWYPSKLARESHSSYVHTVNLLAVLKRQGIVESERKGRQNIFRLTERGAQLASALEDFAKKYEASEQAQKPPESKQASQPAEQKSPEPEKKQPSG